MPSSTTAPRSILRRFSTLGALAAAGVLLAGCAGTADTAVSGTEDPRASVVTISDNHGTIEVPVDPERVVALDNTVFETLSTWGVELVAAPKPVMGQLWPEYTEDENVLDVGSHREPNLEAVIEAEPDLVIGGYRFADVYDDLVGIQPATIETNARDGEDHTDELKRQTLLLGQVFDREAEAQSIADDLDAAIAGAADAYNGTDTVMGLITSGGEIAYAAPAAGRGVGVLFPTLGLTPAIEQAAEDTAHGDDISLESIAQANPEWLIVLDRDGAFQEEGYVPAADLIANAEALKNVPAVQKEQIIVLDPNFYLDEGIQAYTELYASVGDAFAQAK